MDREKAERIRELYFSRQHNQSQLAAMFGIGQPSVSRIVSGQTSSHQ